MIDAMALSNNGRFRITIWPGSPLPTPNFRHIDCTLSDSGGALFITKTGEIAESHGEIYLELANLDLDDRDAIAAFANKYSVLRGAEVYSRLRDADVLPASSSWVRPAFRPSFPREQRLAYEEAYRERIFRDDLPVRTEIETIYEFRFAATVFAQMLDAWQRLSTGRNRDQTRDSQVAYWTGLWSQTLLREGLPALLRNYSPSLAFQRSSDGEAWQPAEIVAEAPVTSAPLYEVCAFELFNHIVQSATYRQCENETCGRLFVHQHGRAQHRQNRSIGIKYCSYHCAVAQNQRTYRRRKQAKRRNPETP